MPPPTFKTPTPFLNPATPAAPTGAPAAPQGGDTVSQMKAYLQQSGYTPPAPTTPSSSNDWYSQLQTAHKEVTDQSYGGFGKVAGAIGESFNTRADEVGKVLSSTDNPLSKVLQVAGKGAAVVNDVAGDVIKTAIKPEVLQSFGEHLAPLVQAAHDTPAGKAVIGWWEGLSPEVQRNLSATGSIASLLSNAVGAGAAEKGAVAGGEAALAATEGATTALKSGVKQLATTASKPVRESVQGMAAEGKIPGIEGLGAQTKTSATRMAQEMPLIGAGAARRAKPVDAYNSFAQQEAKHLSDIKQDPAISLVGSRIGDAFDEVVKQRQAVGKTMASELEKTAGNAVDVKDPLESFHKELAASGSGLHRTEDGLDILHSKVSKFSTDDNKILKTYANELDMLGKHPTMAQVDAFVSRMPKEIEGLKASANITFKTNAERIINNSLNDFRTVLSKNGGKAYSDARAQYADLSKFIDEGAKHLGKITQSGDYAKDASIAKSSVQSVLNNGKKDWLIELENKTGYPAMDEATLALQAMKDAGDFKGNSLLDLLTEGASGTVPLSAHGVAGKIMGMMGKGIGKAVAGSKADQTRAFLKTLETQGKETLPAIAPKVESSANPSMMDKAKQAFKKVKTEGNRGFVALPSVGSKVLREPAKVAKDMTANDFKAVQEYLNTKAKGTNTFVSPEQGMALDDVMERLGLEKASSKKPSFENEDDKIAYLTDLVKAYNAHNTEGQIIEGAPTKMFKNANKKANK